MVTRTFRYSKGVFLQVKVAQSDTHHRRIKDTSTVLREGYTVQIGLEEVVLRPVDHVFSKQRK